MALAAVLAPSAGIALEFTFEMIPSVRPREAIAWHDVNGDGRKDLVRQTERLLEIFLLGNNHHIEKTPAWRVEIAPPWDLWDFADVRSEMPGDELLALSPEGLGWMSFHQGTTSTARMDILISEKLPVRWDERYARRGRMVVRLSQDRPEQLLLPSRKGLKVYRRAKAYGRWEMADELTAPLRPYPSFRAASNQPFALGFGGWIPVRGFRTLSASPPSPTSWHRYGFGSSWSASTGRLIDWNGDGRLDWITKHPDRTNGMWQIYLQDGQGRFDRDNPVGPFAPPQDDSDSDEANEEDDEAPEEPLNLRLRAQSRMDLENLADVNGDGRLDLLRISTVESLAAPKTRVAVHLQDAQGRFAKKPDSLLRLRAVLPSERLPLADIDGDGDLDLLLLRIDLQMGSANSHVKAFFRKGLRTDLGAYPWRGRSGYPKRPAWEKPLIITHDMFEFGSEPRPLMQFDRDLTGDGKPDLAARLSRDKVGVFRLLDAKSGFAKTVEAEHQAPFKIVAIRCEDFDGDGHNDILLEGWNPDDPDRNPQAVLFAEIKPETGG